MKRLNDPTLQMLATFVAKAEHVPPGAQQTLYSRIVQLDDELTALRSKPHEEGQGKRGAR